MLTSFPTFGNGGADSLSLSSSFSCSNPPRLRDELLASVDTDRTLVIHDHPSTRPPSPGPLLFVSVPLPVERSDFLSPCGCVTSSPTAARASASPAGVSVTPSPRREGAASHSTSRATHNEGSQTDLYLRDDDDDSSSDSSVEFECTTVSVSTARSCDAPPTPLQEDEWEVVWRHVFPMHMASFLTVRDVLEVGLVCRRAAAAVQQPWVWRTLARWHFGTHPSGLERVFRAAAQEWQHDSGNSRSSNSAGPSTPQPATDAASVLWWQERRAAAQAVSEGDDEVRRSDDDATGSEPDVQLVSEEEDRVVDALVEEEGEAAAEVSSVDTTRAPTRVRDMESDAEDDADVDAPDSVGDGDAVPHTVFLVESATALSSLVRPAASAASPAAGAAGVGVTFTPTLMSTTAPRAASRYLWQTAAAAMPSPSSPVTTPHQEKDDDDDDHDEDGKEEQNESEGCAEGESAVDASSASGSRSFMAPLPPAASCGPHPCPPAAAPMAAVEVAEQRAEGSWRAEKGGSGRRPPALERLPPPTPAQLDGDAHTTPPHRSPVRAATAARQDAFRRFVSADDGELGRSTSFSSPCLGRHPSYVLDMATDVTVTNAESLASARTSPCTLQFDESTAPRSPSAFSSSLPLSPALAHTAAPTRCYTLCRATAERTVLARAPQFPWQAMTRFLYAHRVQTTLSRLTALCDHARAELCRGAWESAYGSLSHVVHALLQPGSCRAVELLQLLAQSLVRRASLCRHRGHVHPHAALMDLCTAALLCPDSAATADIVALCTRPEFAAVTPASWLAAFDAAAATPSPVALLGHLAQVPFLFPRHRALCFGSAVAAYMTAHRALGQPLSHLLCRAAEWATPGTEEPLLVQALRQAAVARLLLAPSSGQGAQAASPAARAAVRRACATADYALSLMPLQVRRTVDLLGAAWVRDCIHADGTFYGPAMAHWTTHAAEAVYFAGTASLEVRWLAWLTCEVHAFVHRELTDSVPAVTALSSVVLALTRHHYADGLVRIAAQYASLTVRTEDLVPSLPSGASRRCLTQYMLHTALQLRPLHPTAAVLLSRLYAAQAEEEEEEEGQGSGASAMASAVLTDCIHRWARRFCLLGAATTTSAAAAAESAPYLHRRERSPALCFIPSELLVSRNHCLHQVADLAEATEQHPSLSFPYQMRAAMAMDRGYHLAAVMEMGRVMKMTLDPADAALRVRFLQDAIALSTPVSPHAADTTPTSVAAPGASASALYATPSLSSVAASSTDDVEAVRLPEEATATAALPPPQELLPAYRALLARTCGLLALLHPSASSPAQPQRSTSGAASSPSFSRVMTGDMPSTGTLDMSVGHVSRVASMALSEMDGDSAAIGSGAGTSASVDTANIRAFLEDLVGAHAVGSAAVL